MSLPRRRLHRATFALAAACNVAWGTCRALDPQAGFRRADMQPLSRPGVFRRLAVVVALHGVAHAEVARRPEHGFVIAAVGLAGTLLGPAGMAAGIAAGRWPPGAFAPLLFDDVAWWLPFGLSLRDAWPAWRATWPQGAEAAS